MSEFFVTQVPISEVERMAADGWQVSERVCTRHGRYCVLMFKPIDNLNWSMSMDATDLDALDPESASEIPGNLERFIKTARDEAGIGAVASRDLSGIAMASLVTYVLQHQHEIVALVNLGVDYYHKLTAEKVAEAASQE